MPLSSGFGGFVPRTSTSTIVAASRLRGRSIGDSPQDKKPDPPRKKGCLKRFFNWVTKMFK